jgi:hypothetical protein
VSPAENVQTPDLSTISTQKPERETQVRPLVGLSKEAALSAWANAVKMAGGQKITARLVKAAVRQLNGPQPETSKPAAVKGSKLTKRRLVDDKIGEVLLLLSQKADYAILTKKVEELHAQVRAILTPAKAKSTTV